MLKHRVLFDEQMIAARVQELARTIAADLPEPTPVLIGLLTVRLFSWAIWCGHWGALG